jgi:hypothetical protein
VRSAHASANPWVNSVLLGANGLAMVLLLFMRSFAVTVSFRQENAVHCSTPGVLSAPGWATPKLARLQPPVLTLAPA